MASTSETEGEEQRNRARGCFPFDDNLFDTVLNNKELCNQQLNMDSDIEMNSLGNNSFSEQAWDNYQVIIFLSFSIFLFKKVTVDMLRYGCYCRNSLLSWKRLLLIFF